MQLLGAALIGAALYMLAGPWWACLAVGAVLVALGYLAERASDPRKAPSDRRTRPNSKGAA
jgi:membrane protein implicated in regulation of membrane protease activity